MILFTWLGTRNCSTLGKMPRFGSTWTKSPANGKSCWKWLAQTTVCVSALVAATTIASPRKCCPGKLNKFLNCQNVRKFRRWFRGSNWPITCFFFLQLQRPLLLQRMHPKGLRCGHWWRPDGTEVPDALWQTIPACLASDRPRKANFL